MTWVWCLVWAGTHSCFYYDYLANTEGSVLWVGLSLSVPFRKHNVLDVWRWSKNRSEEEEEEEDDVDEEDEKCYLFCRDVHWEKEDVDEDKEYDADKEDREEDIKEEDVEEKDTEEEDEDSAGKEDFEISCH